MSMGVVDDDRDRNRDRAADKELREHVSNYLARQTSLDELEEWFFSWAFDYRPSHGSLLGEVECILGQHSSGYGTEAQVRDQLRAASYARLGQYTVIVDETQVSQDWQRKVRAIPGVLVIGTDVSNWGPAIRPLDAKLAASGSE